MDILKGHPVSRCPSLEYVEAAIRRHLSPAAAAAPTAAPAAKGKKAATAAGRGGGKATKKNAQPKSTIGSTSAAMVSFSETEVRTLKPEGRKPRTTLCARGLGTMPNYILISLFPIFSLLLLL